MHGHGIATPYEKGRTFEETVGEKGRKRLGARKWRRKVGDVVGRLKEALRADCVVIGGGNVKRLDTLPVGATRGDNANAFLGGVAVAAALRPDAQNRLRRRRARCGSGTPGYSARSATVGSTRSARREGT
jgi:hypothetical protein